MRTGLFLGGALALGRLTGCAPHQTATPGASATPLRTPPATPSPDLDDLPWPEARAIVATTTGPSFPDRFFIVTNPPYLASADGKADSTQAFRRAIHDCSRRRAGPAILPPHLYSLP